MNPIELDLLDRSGAAMQPTGSADDMESIPLDDEEVIDFEENRNRQIVTIPEENENNIHWRDVLDHAYNLGHNLGHNLGYNHGRDQGYNQGYNQGWNDFKNQANPQPPIQINAQVQAPIKPEQSIFGRFFYPEGYVRSKTCPKVKLIASPLYEVDRNFKNQAIYKLDDLVSQLNECLSTCESSLRQPIKELVQTLSCTRDQATQITSNVSGVFINAARAHPHVRDLKSYWVSQTIDFNHPVLADEIEALEDVANGVSTIVTEGEGKNLLDMMTDTNLPKSLKNIKKDLQELPDHFKNGYGIFDADVQFLIQTFNMDAANESGHNMKKLFWKGGVPALLILGGIGCIGLISAADHEVQVICFFSALGLCLVGNAASLIIPGRFLGGFKNIFCWRERYAHHSHLSEGIHHTETLELQMPQLELRPSEAKASLLVSEIKDQWSNLKHSLARDPSTSSGAPLVACETEKFINTILEEMMRRVRSSNLQSERLQSALLNKDVGALKLLFKEARELSRALPLETQWSNYTSKVKEKTAPNHEAIGNFLDGFKDKFKKRDTIITEHSTSIAHLSKKFSKKIRISNWISSGTLSGLLFLMAGMLCLALFKGRGLEESRLGFWICFGIGCFLIALPIAIYLFNSFVSWVFQSDKKYSGTDSYC